MPNLSSFLLTLKGGSGSGNFGHGGRPGKRGGSSTSSSSEFSLVDFSSLPKLMKGQVSVSDYQVALEYIAHDYERVNNYLRGEELSETEVYGDPEEGIDSVHRIIGAMDRYTSALKFPENSKVYRAFRSNAANDLRGEIVNLKPGQKISPIKTYQSVSTNKEYISGNFSQRAVSSSKPLIFEINAKKNRKYGIGDKGEEELILPRNINYTYMGTRVDPDGTEYVMVEY